MKKPSQRPYICFPVSFRIPVYSDKEPTKRVGSKSVTVGRREYATALKVGIDELSIFDYRRHRKASPSQFVRMTAGDLWMAFPDDFENPNQVGRIQAEEGYYGD